MRHLTKLLIVLSFVIAAVACFSGDGSKVSPTAQVTAPTPPAANAANAAANAAAPASTPAATGGKTIAKDFILGKESQTEDGEVPFNHETHSVKNYSPDGKSPVTCVECHHTDQPKSALKPPLATSEREVVLTLASWQASNQKVKGCRECHFQSGNIPEGGTMPTATITERGKQVTKDLNNELAYHINCNTCHDSAAKLRPEIKSHAGFAISTDCKTCHRPN